MTNKLLEQAQQQHQQGKLEEALESYQQVLKDDPNQPEVLHLVGIIQAQLGNFSNSLQYLNYAIELQPEAATFYNSKGNVLLRTDQLVEATKAYHIAISLKPNYAVAYNNLGNSFYRQHKLNNAKKAYQKAIALEPDFANAHFNYGRLLTEEEDYDFAISELKKAISLDENHGPALGQLAHIYQHKNDYTKAIEYFKKRSKLQPHHVETHHDLGVALLKVKDWAQASEQLTYTIELDPQHPLANYHLATACLQMGEHKKALNHYLRQIEIESHLESYYNIGVLLMYEERHRDAIDYLKKALDLKPTYFDAHINIAAIYLKLGRTQEAIEHYQLALKLRPNDPEILHILSALEQKETPQTAPSEYVQHLFDQYALYYDLHLTQHLDYQVPTQIHRAIEIDTNADHPEWKIVDLGCGTGLCGELFKDMAKELIGIDISANMIDIAKQKNIYDEVIVGNIQDVIDNFKDVDLMIAADVLTYVGDLDSLFCKVNASLKKGGHFTFTVEKTAKPSYILQQNIRYAHNKSYLESLIKHYQFNKVRFDNITLRKQKGKPVEGFLVVLKK